MSSLSCMEAQGVKANQLLLCWLHKIKYGKQRWQKVQSHSGLPQIHDKHHKHNSCPLKE